MEQDRSRLVRAVAEAPDDPAAFDDLVAWLARRLDAASDLRELAASLLGELPVPRRARVLDAAAARAGVAFGAGALVANPWVPSECWALAPDGASLFSTSSSSAVLLHGEDLAERLDLELPDPEKFLLGPLAAGVNQEGVVVARQLRVSREEDGEPREDFFLRFDRYDRAREGWALSLTHPDLQTEEVWVAPGLEGAVAADRGELMAFDLRAGAADPGPVRRRPSPHTDVTPAGYLAPDRFLLVEDEGYLGDGTSRIVVWEPSTGQDLFTGGWRYDLAGLAPTPGSPWVLAWGPVSDGRVEAMLLEAEDLGGASGDLGWVPQLRTGRVSPCGRWVVGRGEQHWVLDGQNRDDIAFFRLGSNLRVSDANDAGLVVVGWDQPQVLDVAARRPQRSPYAPASSGASFQLQADRVVLATRGDGVQRRWDRTTGACAAVFTDTPLPLPDRVVHLAECAEAPTAVEVLDPSTGDLRRRFHTTVTEGALAGIATSLAPVDLVGASPDGRVVIAYRVLSAGLITAFDVEIGEILWEARGHPVDDPIASDGTLVMLGEKERRQFPFRKVDVLTGETTTELVLPRIGSTIPRMAVDPIDGACWLFSSRAVVRVDPGEAVAEEVELPGETRALAFDQAGTFRARSIEGRVLVLEDRATGAEVRRWETEAWIDPPLAFAEGALWAVIGSVLRRLELP